MTRRRRLFVLGSLTLALLVVAGLAVAWGAVPLDWRSGDQKTYIILYLIRIPRVLTALLVGAALALCGAVMQGVLRNPMADPGIIGVSSGAGFGAVLAIGLGLAGSQGLWLPVLAALGALLAAGVIFGLSLNGGRLSLFTLVLAGMAVSTFFGAATSLVLSLVSKDSVQQFLFWAMGSLANARWESLGWGLIPLALGLLSLPWFAPALNLLLLGEEAAQGVGLAVARTRFGLLVLVSITTAAAVCLSGPIGFVGLMVPHIMRLLVGPDYRDLLPASLLGGALFLLLCDLLARLVLPGQELNVGIITAMLGAPYFLLLLIRARRSGEAL